MTDSQAMVSALFVSDLRCLSEIHIPFPLRAWYHPTVYYLSRVWLWGQEVNNLCWLEPTMFVLLCLLLTVGMEWHRC